ncbi:MAG TPA: alpha/beta hydrolase [Geminicoccaceae bacterium]|nr:alpha/beta hydrolase [Geminicoccaceae bacterium]
MEITVRGQPAFAATGGRPFDPVLPAVVFVHGAGMDHTVWQLQTRYFAHHGRSVLAVDLPGHGRSAGPALATVADMALWLGELIEAAGATKSVALVGHSMGALVALQAAAGRDDVGALALLGVAARMPVHPGLLEAAERDDPLAVELITSWAFGRAAHIGGHRAPGLWMTGGGRRLLGRSAPGVLYRDLAACDAYGDALAAAAAVRCPALLLLGAWDAMTPPRVAAPLAEALREVRTTVLPECGHMMMIERPDASLDALRGIVR